MLNAGEPVAIVQGPHRGRWGYVDATDGVEVLVLFAHLPADEGVTVPVGDVCRITFLPREI